jgi:hypothetical protein
MSAETNMFEAEIKTRHNGSITTAFSDLSDTPKLNNITRYQTRFHNLHSRAFRDLINLRKAVPSSARPPAEWPMPAEEPVPNEPKTPSVCNKSTPIEPGNEPVPTHPAAAKSSPSPFGDPPPANQTSPVSQHPRRDSLHQTQNSDSTQDARKSPHSPVENLNMPAARLHDASAICMNSQRIKSQKSADFGTPRALIQD